MQLTRLIGSASERLGIIVLTAGLVGSGAFSQGTTGSVPADDQRSAQTNTLQFLEWNTFLPSSDQLVIIGFEGMDFIEMNANLPDSTLLVPPGMGDLQLVDCNTRY